MLEMLGEKRGVALTITKGLPLSSGLGGSAASAAAAVVAVNDLCGGKATMDQLVAAALIGEGLGAGGAHPDNIAPAICGGFVLVRHPNPPDIVRLPVPDGLTCVVIHPDLEIETAKARALLGTTVELKDAIRQWANLGAMVHALHTSDFELLARTLEDSVAEPKRAPLIPGLANIKKAATDAGALGSSISGSGPSIFALCHGRPAADRVAAAMTAAVAQEIGGESQVYVSAISSRGARVIS
jgi:homoserine kinase